MRFSPPVHVAVVGIGADGWSGVPERLRSVVLDAEVLLGGDQHLDLVPDVDRQEREAWPHPLRDGLPAVLRRHAGRRVVALAAGDPFLSGIGTTLVDLLGAESVTVEPTTSSVALARARMGWSAESTTVVPVAGRDPHVVLRHLAPGHRLVVLSPDAATPELLAGLLVMAGYGGSAMTVLGDLGGERECRVDTTAADWSGRGPDLPVVALELAGPVVGSWAPGLPDEHFENDGRLTRRDLRASALARLAPQPGQLLWDVGAGAGSIGIEWMRAHPSCRAVAVEVDPGRAARVGRNAVALGVPDLEVVTGHAPEVLVRLPKPDAVFVGGGATAAGLLSYCLRSLRPGGRLVVQGTTLETEQALAAAYARSGGELTRLSVEQAAPSGASTGWTPARTITQWSVSKELARG
ncbi:precorrin-6y C5,15-methyltransferase (decarboxylating) subunit CbiE [Nocardioides koreensis]|uniref:precorrin-6y C5,15-methyltransferase (decarboxylating) subunit CbiE n=1 Tax=Nocardioides koreensis TaxID=433651 RepID=UPI0031D238D4